MKSDILLQWFFVTSSRSFCDFFWIGLKQRYPRYLVIARLTPCVTSDTVCRACPEHPKSSTFRFISLDQVSVYPLPSRTRSKNFRLGSNTEYVNHTTQILCLPWRKNYKLLLLLLVTEEFELDPGGQLAQPAITQWVKFVNQKDSPCWFSRF